ncbi:transcriptional regulator [Rhodococcus coprophilus]|nr:transcriptional regulator [Rhodococcus coprophilus]MBM7459954.1 DNA-binding MarR family transcriptional regulator [Rhodococcus coprophilus]
MPDTSSPDEHPTLGLDDVVHQRTRLGILSLLRDGASMQFGVLRETLRLTDGNLNRHLKVLVDAGLLESTREERKGRARTWVTITPAGRAALDAEIAALRTLIGAHD